MALDWIKIRIDLPNDPAVIGIAAALSLSEDEIVGKLFRLWGWADRHVIDGRAKSITPAWVDRFVGCPGFAAAMVAEGWLAFDGAGVVFPNFDRHNGQSAKARAGETERKRRQRDGRPEDDRTTPNHSSVSLVPEVSGTVSANLPDKSVTRLEKIREENTPPNPQPGDGHDPLRSPEGDPEPSPKGVEPAGFVSFWAAFPGRRKSGRAECLRVWRRRSLESIAAQVIAGLDRWKASEDWAKDGGQFIPGPVPWLNKSRWEAEPPPARATARNGYPLEQFVIVDPSPAEALRLLAEGV